jgi:hypothetical protein
LLLRSQRRHARAEECRNCEFCFHMFPFARKAQLKLRPTELMPVGRN